MFNRYFEAGEDSMEFLYAHLTVKNIDFALISLSYILDNETDIDYKRYRDERTFYFFHIQSILSACGIINDVFYSNNMPWSNTRHRQINRGKLLRDTFGVCKRRFPIIFDKAARNTNVHFDERIDSFGWNVGDYNIIDDSTTDRIRHTLLNQYHLRTFDRTNGCYYTYVRNRDQLVTKTINFYELRGQLEELRDIIVQHSVFESRWIDRMPGDILE